MVDISFYWHVALICSTILHTEILKYFKNRKRSLS